MSLILRDISVSDAENIARYVQIPAMQNGPLYRIMFPWGAAMTDLQKDEVTRWYSDMIRDATEDQLEEFLKVCFIDGFPIGFCGWTVVRKKGESGVEPRKNEVDKRQKQGNEKKGFWIPETIDEKGWVRLSGMLRTERNRVLENLDTVTRGSISWWYQSELLIGLLGLTFMAVNPKYQRRGIGSMMMQRICEETDQHGRYAYVLAAPEGVRLYAKFGFSVVGCVNTSQGTITSMLRPPRSGGKKD